VAGWVYYEGRCSLFNKRVQKCGNAILFINADSRGTYRKNLLTTESVFQSAAQLSFNTIFAPAKIVLNKPFGN
jgi:hypothetical protein